jgi:uncharacterized protein YjbI with pentapeptide repeats
MRYLPLINILYCLLATTVYAEVDNVIEQVSPDGDQHTAIEPTVATAEVNANVKKLIETRQCAECDLRYADLSNLDLSGVELLDANLQHANLSHSRFVGANLAGADFSYVNLSASNLQEAEIHGANFYEADLKDADIQLKEILERGAFSEKPRDQAEERPIFRGIRG